MIIDARAIEQAYASIDPIFLNSPQLEFEALNDVLAVRLLLKLETLNPIRSFKGRGADYFVQQHTDTKAFVCASAGNFGQGMAYACRKAQMPLIVFAAETANPLKLERMRQLGAEVRIAGSDFDAAKEAAKAYAASKGWAYVEDGREAEITIGAGTIALELSRYTEAIDAVLVPLGNGALINGMGTWLKAQHPHSQVIAVVAQGAPAMDLSWRAGQLISTPSVATIADGIAVRNPVPEALALLKDCVDDIVQVSDDSILRAMKLIQHHAGLLIEPAGVAGLAAVLDDPTRFKGKVLATPLCGSNISPENLSQWLG